MNQHDEINKRTRLCIGSTTGSRSSLVRILLPETAVKKLPMRVLEKLQLLSLASDSAPDETTDSSSVSESSSSLSSCSYCGQSINVNNHTRFTMGNKRAINTYANVRVALSLQLRRFFSRRELARAVELGHLLLRKLRGLPFGHLLGALLLLFTASLLRLRSLSTWSSAHRAHLRAQRSLDLELLQLVLYLAVRRVAVFIRIFTARLGKCCGRRRRGDHRLVGRI